MLSFPRANNWSALEQVSHPSIGAVKLRVEGCGFSGKIRGMCICMNVMQEKQSE